MKIYQKFISLLTVSTILGSSLAAPVVVSAEETSTTVNTNKEDRIQKQDTTGTNTTTIEDNTQTTNSIEESSTITSSNEESMQTESSSDTTTTTTEHTESSSEANTDETSKASSASTEDKKNSTILSVVKKVQKQPATWTTSPVIEQTHLESDTPINYGYNQSSEEFIKKIGEDARTIASKNDLYASVMIAQAILESGSGNSVLARAPYYNLFGIKGTFNGASVSMKTQEDDGKGNLYSIFDSFRQYPSYKESLTDYAKLLKSGLSGNQAFYSGVWKSHAKTYKEATSALTGKYATDTRYAEKLNKLIEVYNLTQYDQPKADKKAEASKPKAHPQPVKNIRLKRTSDKVKMLELYPENANS